jgi:hypothetical protein
MGGMPARIDFDFPKPACEILSLKRLDDILHVHPFMGGYALQNDGRQSPFDHGMHRDGHSLKPGI